VDHNRNTRKGVLSVEEVVARVFNLDASEVTDQSSRKTIAEWDSMGHLSLINGLEEEFKVSIAIADAMEMTSVQHIKKILKDYKVAP
jgi:acyl carrier protein